MVDYTVRPLDVLYFRGNKAFDFGEWYSEGIFPPYPSTFQGFIRTLILKKNGQIKPNGELKNPEAAKKLVGDDHEFPFEIIGPFIVKQNKDLKENINFFMPMPMDVVKAENSNFKIGQLTLSKKPIQTDLGLKLFYSVFTAKPKFFFYQQPYCLLSQFKDYRKNGIMPVVENAKSPDFEEQHIGISLQYNRNSKRTKQAEESLFYMTPYNRLPHDMRLYFRISCENNDIISDLEKEYCKLGSEGRGAIIENCAPKLVVKFNENEFYDDLVKQKKFKLILLQPGLFKNGWVPFENKSGDWKIFTYNGLELKLLYAQTGDVKKISGMSMRQQKINDNQQRGSGLKPMLNAVPAGAVYYFEILRSNASNDISAQLKELDGSKIPNEPYSTMGFNQVALAKIIEKSN